MPPGRVVYRSSHVPILAGGRSIGRSIRRVRPRGNACHTYNRNVIERIGSGSHGQLGSHRRLGCGCVGCGCRSAGWAGATDAAGATRGRAPERRVHRIDKVEARASHRGRWHRGAATAVGRAGARPGVAVLPKSGILRRQTRPRSSLIVVGYCCRVLLLSCLFSWQRN